MIDEIIGACIAVGIGFCTGTFLMYFLFCDRINTYRKEIKCLKIQLKYRLIAKEIIKFITEVIK